VPTMIESGYPGFVSMSWTGIVAPVGTPPEIVAKINRAVVDSFRSKEAAGSLARLGAEPNSGTPESFGTTIATEIPKWAEIATSCSRLVRPIPISATIFGHHGEVTGVASGAS
jgi:tripartite-type tricarboxylate transporter receptor subunit TctC